jgi:hypothetical protein
LQDTLQLPADDAAGLLQLAMNSMHQHIRAAAASCLPPQLSAIAAKRLLLTAAARQCKYAVYKLATSAAVQQHVDACLLAEVLSFLPESCESHERWVGGVASSLYLKWPTAAAALSSDAVFKLLKVAVEQGCRQCVSHLCSLPAAQQLSRVEISQVLTGGLKAGRFGCSDCVEIVCSLPVAQQLSVDEVRQLLAVEAEKAAMKNSSPGIFNFRDCSEALQQGAQQVQVVYKQVYTMKALAEAARMQGLEVAGPFHTHLLSLPAARQLWCATTQRLLQICVNPGTHNHESAGRLYALRLPFIFSGKVVEQLFFEALHQGANACLQYLCTLRDALHLDAGVLAQLLSVAERQSNQDAVDLLQALSEAKQGT